MMMLACVAIIVDWAGNNFKLSIFRYYKLEMGRPARNYGGTLGHGCLPLPGEAPNYNRHVLEDRKLQGLVPKNTGNRRSITKLATKSESIDNHGPGNPTLSKDQDDAYTIKEKERVQENKEHRRMPSPKATVSLCVKKSKRSNTSESIKICKDDTLDTISRKSSISGCMKEAGYSNDTRHSKHMKIVKQTVTCVELPTAPKAEPLSSMKQPPIHAKQSLSSDPGPVEKDQLLKSYKDAQLLPSDNNHMLIESQSVSSFDQPELSSSNKSQTELPVVCLKDQLKWDLSVAQEQRQQQVVTPKHKPVSSHKHEVLVKQPGNSADEKDIDRAEQFPKISKSFSQPPLPASQNLETGYKLSGQKKISLDQTAKELNSSCQQPSNSLTSYLIPVISFWHAPLNPQAPFIECVFPYPYFGPIQNDAEVAIQSTKDQFIPTHSQNVIQSNKILPMLD